MRAAFVTNCNPFVQMLVSSVRVDVELIVYEYAGVTVDHLLYQIEERLQGRRAKYAVPKYVCHIHTQIMSGYSYLFMFRPV